MLDKNVDGHGVLLMLLVYSESLLVQAVLSGNTGDISGIIVLELVDVTNNLALVRTDGSEQQKVLEVLVVAEW